MRILYIHQYFAVPEYGGGTRSYEMARRLVAAGNEVTMLTSSAFLPDEWVPRSGWNIRDVDGIRVEILRLSYSNNLPLHKRLTRFIHFVASSIKHARKWSGDVVFATSTPLTVALPAIHVSRYNQVPMVFEVRDLWPEMPIAIGAIKNPVLISIAKWLEKLAYRNSTKIIALSPGMAEGIRRTGYSSNDITVIPNACDLELFGSYPKAREKFLDDHPYLVDSPVIVYAGTLGHLNDVDYLVDIAVEMRILDPRVKFIIAGDGVNAPAIRERCERLGLLGSQLWMLPPMSKYEISALLSVATVATSLFIDLPQMWNNSANKFFDSLAAGCPIMINYRGWQEQILKKSGAGIVVPPNDGATAARMLFELVNNNKELSKMGVAARLLAETSFDRDELALEMQKVIHQAVMDYPNNGQR